MAQDRAASATGPAPEVHGSIALAIRPEDQSFLRALRTLIDRPELTSNFYDDREWAYKSSIPQQLGKYLSMVLRHRATLMQIYVDEEGYVTWTFAAGLQTAAPPTATGRAASAAGPAPEVPGSTALAVSPTDPSFLRALRTLTRTARGIVPLHIRACCQV